jgi:hypothetical protein
VDRSERHQEPAAPLLIIDGELDHTVPWAIAHALHEAKRNSGVTETQDPRWGTP